MSPEREAVLRHRWKDFRSAAYHMLDRQPSTCQLVMHAPEAPTPVFAFNQGEPPSVSFELDRTVLGIIWDIVAEPYRSLGVRGCIVQCEGIVLDRFDWRLNR